MAKEQKATTGNVQPQGQTIPPEGEQQPLRLHVEPGLDYKYRDLFNLHVGAEDVLIEFGNLHRNVQGQGVILDRVVLSPANAIRLHQGLGQALQQMQQRMRELQAQAQQQEGGDTPKAQTQN